MVCDGGRVDPKLHHRLGRVIEERAHVRELYEPTVIDDGEYVFGTVDDWGDDDDHCSLKCSKLLLNTRNSQQCKKLFMQGVANEAPEALADEEAAMRTLVENICKKHGVPKGSSTYLVLRTLDKEIVARRSKVAAHGDASGKCKSVAWKSVPNAASDENFDPKTVAVAKNWLARVTAKSLHKRQSGAQAVAQRMSGRFSLQTDMSIEVLSSRNFQTTMRPAAAKYSDAVQRSRKGQEDPEHLCSLGRLLLAQGRHEDAVQCFHAAVGLRCSYSEARFLLGIALAEVTNSSNVQAYAYLILI